MRVAVAGAHGTGKSTLIAAFLERRPEYVHEPEAFELLGDEVEIDAHGGPTPEGLALLLRHTIESLSGLPPGARVIVERSPVDYLAYAAASGRAWTPAVAAAFLEEQGAAVRRAVRSLDLIALVPVSPAVPGRAGEGARFRKRVDDRLRRALIDDDHDLFGGAGAPRVVELAPLPARQLDELLRLTEALG